MKSIGIVGLGYVGLPLATALAEAGFFVVGVDTDSVKISALGAGESYVEDVPSEQLRALTSSGRLRFTENYGALEEAEAVFLCLPTPLNEYREPDLSAVISGALAVAPNLRPGALIVLESTTYPGTTREVILPIFEQGGRQRGHIEQAQLQVGEDFFLAYSPERIDPGNKLFTVRDIPKVVGGITPECTRRTVELYRTIIEEVHPVSAPESAEMVKLFENIFRSVNIALVNELAVLCHRMDIDVWEVIEMAKTKPFGFMPFYPGPGLGGHCVPVDPFYLSWRARVFDTSTEFIELAGKTNVSMPYRAVGRISSALNAEKKPIKGSRVLLLGVSYKPNIRDIRNSPALDILDLLRASGAKVAYHDPHVPHLPDKKLSSVRLTKGELFQADCVIIVADHEAVDLEFVVGTASLVVDLRDAVRRRIGKLPDNVEVL